MANKSDGKQELVDGTGEVNQFSALQISFDCPHFSDVLSQPLSPSTFLSDLNLITNFMKFSLIMFLDKLIIKDL